MCTPADLFVSVFTLGSHWIQLFEIKKKTLDPHYWLPNVKRPVFCVLFLWKNLSGLLHALVCFSFGFLSSFCFGLYSFCTFSILTICSAFFFPFFQNFSFGVGQDGQCFWGKKLFFKLQKWSVTTEPRKSLVKFRPAWTSTDQCTMQDGWYMDRKQFFSCIPVPQLTTVVTYLTNYAFPSTWPPSALPTCLTTMVTNYLN
jgi:hypothetical protein